MVCKKCGAEITGKGQFCEFCGTPVDGENKDAIKEVQKEERPIRLTIPEQPIVMSNGKRERKKNWLVVALLIILAIVELGVMFRADPEKEERGGASKASYEYESDEYEYDYGYGNDEHIDLT